MRITGDNLHFTVPTVPKRVFPAKEDKEKNESDKQSSDANLDPSAPIATGNKGILTSFVTGKKMAIPEQDVVSGFLHLGLFKFDL